MEGSSQLLNCSIGAASLLVDDFLVVCLFLPGAERPLEGELSAPRTMAGLSKSVQETRGGEGVGVMKKPLTAQGSPTGPQETTPPTFQK